MTAPSSAMESKAGEKTADDFWNNVYSSTDYSKHLTPETILILDDAINHFGDITNKTIIDLGCGGGATSVYLASKGARVIAVDSSEVAIAQFKSWCEANAVHNIAPIHKDAFRISELGQVDYIFGSMILHHLEPFNEFAKMLANTLKPGGKGFFWENNAASELLIFCRENIVGKLWVPKYGDKDEFPLKPAEIEMLRKYFTVTTRIPEMLFFQLIGTYLLRGRGLGLFKRLDDYFFRKKWLTRYSYRQYVMLSR